MKKPDQACQIDPIVQTRLNALERLIDSEYEGKPSVFEVKTGIKMAQVNQWFTGYRALRDKALKRLEEKTKKPAGWFETRTHASFVNVGTPENQPNVAVTHVQQAQVAIINEATKDDFAGLRSLYEAFPPEMRAVAIQAATQAMIRVLPRYTSGGQHQSATEETSFAEPHVQPATRKTQQTLDIDHHAR